MQTNYISKLDVLYEIRYQTTYEIRYQITDQIDPGCDLKLGPAQSGPFDQIPLDRLGIDQNLIRH